MSTVAVSTERPMPPQLMEFLSQNYKNLGLEAGTRLIDRPDYYLKVQVYVNETGECFNYIQGINNTTYIVLFVDEPLAAPPTWILDIINKYREVVEAWDGDFTFQVVFRYEYDSANTMLAKSA